MSQKLLLVDSNDKVLGYSSIEEAHRGRGKHHRAFVTVLLDSRKNLILQRRKHKRFNAFWDLTAISHPLAIGKEIESYQEASDRALFKEQGIAHAKVENIGGFNYLAKDGKDCENEYCAVLVGKYDGTIKPNKDEIYEIKKLSFGEFVNDIRKNPKNYTPWAKDAVEILEKWQSRQLEKELKTFLLQFNKFSSDFWQKRSKNLTKYPGLIGSLYKNLEGFTKGGKALRPFLVYLGYLAAGGKKLNEILPLCLAVELVHSAFLIQDDIIDKSSFRRGKSTIHKTFEAKFGEHYGLSQAMLVADIAIFEAFALIDTLKFSFKVKESIRKRLISVFLETSYGQILDVELSHKESNISEIWKMTELKTAKYSFVGPLITGALVAGGSARLMESLTNYGINLGVAFQLKDDELGVFGSEQTMGKSALSDLVEGKNTILFYKTRELAGANFRKKLQKLWGKKQGTMADLGEVQSIMAKSGARAWLTREMRSRASYAKALTGNITKDKKLLALLAELADFVVERDS